MLYDIRMPTNTIAKELQYLLKDNMKLIRAKANLFTIRDESVKYGWHYDLVQENNVEKPLDNFKTLLYYINNNNGGTEFTFLKMYDGGDASVQLGSKHSLGYISFQAGNGAYTERMRIKNNGDIIHIDSPSKLPDVGTIDEMREPIVEANILVPDEYIGAVIKLCIEKRGMQKNLQYVGGQVSLSYDLPMNEVVMDFFDRLKSVSRGFASLDYNFDRFQEANLVRLDVLINGDRVDALALIVHRDNAHRIGRQLADKMKDLVPRQMFDVAIQAAIGGNVVARTTVKALRKNVTAKCYGGDISRKKKLLQKQKAGKKRMRQFGKVEIPQEAFIKALKTND